MTKVLRDEPVTEAKPNEAQVALARQETEGTQLVVAADRGELRDVDVRISPLSRSDGASFPGEVRWHLVGYVPMTRAPPQRAGKVELWPDPLLPPGKFSVPKGKAQPVWVNVTTSADAAPGLYSGTITVQPANGEARSLRLAVRVWDFTLPRPDHLKTLGRLKTLGGLSIEPILRFYGLKSPEEPDAAAVIRSFAKLALSHRLGPGETLGCGFRRGPQWPVRKSQSGYDFSQATLLLSFCVGEGMTCFLMASIPSPWELGGWGCRDYRAEWTQDFKDFVSAYAGFLRQKGWENSAYVRNFDGAPKEYWPVVRRNRELIRAAAPKVRVIHAISDPEAVQALDGFVDAWQVPLGEHARFGLDKRQETGGEVWWSLSAQEGDKPGLLLHHPAIAQRILGWLACKYRVNGVQYGDLTDWEEANLVGENGKKWPGVPWRTGEHGGDGYLCYPGPDREPLSSIRMENLRDGLEDSEYLWLLRERLPELRGKARTEAEKALAIEAPLAASPSVFTRDPERVLERRAAIAALLEPKP